LDEFLLPLHAQPTAGMFQNLARRFDGWARQHLPMEIQHPG
jgi:hypothetical protein